MKTTSSNGLKYWLYIFAISLPISLKAQQFVTPSLDKKVNDSISVSVKTETLDKKKDLDNKNKNELQINEAAVNLIKFDFSAPHQENIDIQIAPAEKSWMEYQVDLSIPKNLTDTAKVRKPENPRLLPYTIWTEFGEDPVYDVLVFGNKKELKMKWALDLNTIYSINYGRSVLPIPPNMKMLEPSSASCVIRDLDFMGFIYDNFTKQGRIKKHNKKYANAWKTYANSGPLFNDEVDSIPLKTKTEQRDPEFGKQYESILLLDRKSPTSVTNPDYKFIQKNDESRVGMFSDSEIYSLPDSVSTKDTKKNKNSTHKHRRKKKSSKKKEDKKETEDHLDELPKSLDDFYKKMRKKEVQDSIRRVKKLKKEKFNRNSYELNQAAKEVN